VSVKLVVIGAGPIGVAAALAGTRRGFEVTVLERDDVGASLRTWGATRLFSPLAMNVPPGTPLALPGDAILTGPDFVDHILVPLARTLDVRTRHTVVSVSRAGMSRDELVGHPIRGERGFRLLVDTPDGERDVEADAVIDASGATTPVRLGARGERSAAIVRTLGELLGSRAQLAGKRLVLVGAGHSAANAIEVLAALAAEAPTTRVTWAVRVPNLKPCV
jgi:thioredoxin reductase